MTVTNSKCKVCKNVAVDNGRNICHSCEGLRDGIYKTNRPFGDRKHWCHGCGGVKVAGHEDYCDDCKTNLFIKLLDDAKKAAPSDAQLEKDRDDLFG